MPRKSRAPPAAPRERWTREQCAVLETSRLFERERLELVDGDLLGKMRKNRPHVNALLGAFGKQFVDSEAPIEVNPGDNP